MTLIIWRREVSHIPGWPPSQCTQTSCLHYPHWGYTSVPPLGLMQYWGFLLLPLKPDRLASHPDQLDWRGPLKLGTHRERGFYLENPQHGGKTQDSKIPHININLFHHLHRLCSVVTTRGASGLHPCGRGGQQPITQADLKLKILLPQLPECCGLLEL